MLEHITEKALAERNLETARYCREWLSHFPGLTRDYASLFVEEGTRKLLFKTPPKERMVSLPKLLRSFHWFLDEHRTFERVIRAEAKKLGCSPQSLRTKAEWPDFKW